MQAVETPFNLCQLKSLDEYFRQLVLRRDLVH